MPGSVNAEDIVEEARDLASETETVLETFREMIRKGPGIEKRSLRDEIEISGDQQLADSVFSHLDGGEFRKAENQFLEASEHDRQDYKAFVKDYNQDYEAFVKNYIFVRLIEGITELRKAKSDAEGLARIIESVSEEPSRHDILRIGALVIDLEESGLQKAVREVAQADRVMNHYEIEIEDPTQVDGYLAKINQELTGLKPHEVIGDIKAMKQSKDRVLSDTESVLGMNREEIVQEYRERT